MIPVEVKAEENVRARSMSEYIKNHPDYQLKGLRISMMGYQDQEWMENMHSGAFLSRRSAES